MIYEYAGFQFEIETEHGRTIATPLPGQHPAAYKEKHARAAVEQYEDDQVLNWISKNERHSED